MYKTMELRETKRDKDRMNSFNNYQMRKSTFYENRKDIIGLNLTK